MAKKKKQNRVAVERDQLTKVARRVECPVCSSDLLTEFDDLKNEIVTLPNFCSGCGSKILSNCPGCNHTFRELARFCSECGAKVYGNAQPETHSQTESTSSNQADAENMLARCRNGIPVGRRVIREMFLVMVRLNPANRSAHIFCDAVSHITETTSRPEIADIVGTALNEADLSEAQADLKSSHEAIWQMANDISVIEILERKFPTCLQFIKGHEWIDSPEKIREAFADRMYRQVTLHTLELATIEEHYRQLVEFYPRYQEVMNRSGFLNGLVAFAAGFFGGNLGVAGAEMWANWQGRNDQEFLEIYGRAVDDFTNAAFSFTQKTEEAVQSVVEQFADDYVSSTKLIYDGLEKAMQSGHNILPVCEALFYVDDPLEAEGAEFLELVIENLKEEGLTASEERELRAGLKPKPEH